MPDAFKLQPVGGGVYAGAVFPASVKLAFKGVSVGIFNLCMAFQDVIGKFTFIVIFAVCETAVKVVFREKPVPVPPAFLELPFVCGGDGAQVQAFFLAAV